MSINILIESPGQPDTFIDCETPAEALEVLRGLGLARRGPGRLDAILESAGPTVEKIDRAVKAREKAVKAPRVAKTKTPRVSVPKGAPATKSDAILEALAAGPATTGDLAQTLGQVESRTEGLLYFLRKRGRVTRFPDGRWQLARK
jgi:hypothetical protein